MAQRAIKLPSPKEVAKRLRRSAGLNKNLSKKEAFLFVVRAFCLLYDNYDTFDCLPEKRRNVASGKQLAGEHLQHMGLRSGIPNVKKLNRAAIKKIEDLCRKIDSGEAGLEQVSSWEGKLGETTAWKVFAFFCPESVPVVDSYICKLTGAKTHAEAAEQVARAAGRAPWQRILKDVRGGLVSAQRKRLTPLRLLDIILLTYCYWLEDKENAS